MILLVYHESVNPLAATMAMQNWLWANAPNATPLGIAQTNGYICHAYEESPLDYKPPVSEPPTTAAAD